MQMILFFAPLPGGGPGPALPASGAEGRATGAEGPASGAGEPASGAGEASGPALLASGSEGAATLATNGAGEAPGPALPASGPEGPASGAGEAARPPLLATSSEKWRGRRWQIERRLEAGGIHVDKFFRPTQTEPLTSYWLSLTDEARADLQYGLFSPVS